MTKEFAVTEIIVCCELLVKMTRICEEKLAAFLRYYCDGEGERPAPNDYPERILNPKLNGTSAILKRLRLALSVFMPHTLPSEATQALSQFVEVGVALVEVLVAFKRIDSLDVSYTCELDLYEYMTKIPVIELTPEQHAANLKAKIKALKDSFFANSKAFFAVTTEIIEASPYRDTPSEKTLAGVLAKMSAKKPKVRPEPVEVIVVGSRTKEVKARREISLKQAEELLMEKCVRENLADKAISERTFRRWERGESTPLAGYSANCRDSFQAFLSWVQGYMIYIRHNLATKHSVVSFNEKFHQ